MELLYEKTVSFINNYSEYSKDLVVLEIFNHHISFSGKMNGSKSKFVAFLIDDKNISFDIKKKLLSSLLKVFFTKYPAPACYNINKNMYNGFKDTIDELVGDLNLTPKERIFKTFG